jgi:membrane-bound ClpP family serine protease
MTNYTTVAVIVGILAVVFGVILYRMCTVVKPGHVGLVFVSGRYRTGLDPGFALVTVIGSVRKVKLGGGANHVLGMLGVADSDISTASSGGSVRVGANRLSAQGEAPIRSGVTVRVIGDLQLGGVLVAEEHQHPGGPNIPTVPQP